MQKDFDNLVCDYRSIGSLAENPFSQRSAYNLELDLENSKSELPDLSEATIVFLIRWKRAAAIRPLMITSNKSALIKSEGGNSISDIYQSASATFPLPPPKRFVRRTIQTL